MSFRQHMLELSRRLMREELGTASCPPDFTLRSRPLNQGPQIFFKTFQLQGQALVDQQFQPPYVRPHTQDDEWIVMCVACDVAHLDDSLFFHFNPLNHAIAGGTTITPTGVEQWFPFVNGTTGYNKVGQYYKFRGPIPQTLWFDIGHESGGGAYNVTVAIGFDLRSPGNAFQSTP